MIPHIFNAFVQQKATIGHFINFNNLIFYFLMIFFNGIVAYGLISRENLKKSPDNLLEIIVPLFATFNLLFWNFIQYLPKEYNILIIPESVIPFTSIFGALLSTTGTVISILAVIKLRKSFGIFVQVRSIICTGVYKYVRHPIYLGYFLSFIGYSLLQGKIYYFLITGFTMLIVLYRAMLEENKLAQHSEEYRAYMEKTPGIWPRFKFK